MGNKHKYKVGEIAQYQSFGDYLIGAEPRLVSILKKTISCYELATYDIMFLSNLKHWHCFEEQLKKIEE